ncbi:DNA cytosine methyltransferase [Listeria welshimeri]|uniref:DNA cytosine methyltransferase n=1 Tax=Listeria welshimeri TaxID=1643 RepID=UPI001625CE6D|nr:DNA cytosine methyltransferase [Listeria welshimeri]MBC2065027.1 DNA cytosine methyltransferase [Listeria welshimeri]MBF2450333.1 DNA cytosine methyltransferase [Listeria welshimeri]
MLDNKYTVIDLFSGAGGLSQGFVQSGYKILAGIDFDDAALKTYEHNIKGAQALKEDLFNEENAMQDIENHLNGEEIDVIIAGPPCQGFSLTGSRDMHDTRNKLYLAVVHAVERFQPKAFLIENVPGMATLYGGAIKQQIINTFEDMGYSVSVTDKPLLAADYGVPQMRKRMFFVGFKKDLNYDYFEFPKPFLESNDYIGTEAAISDLPSLENSLGEEVSEYENKAQTDYQKLMRKGAKYLYNHVGTQHTDEVKWVINQVPEGGNHKDLPEGVGTSRKFNEAWTRYHSQKPSKTIDTGHRNHFHYKWNRVPSVRENARLQSFPDYFEFLGTKTQQNRQVGNAVPPLLAQAIGDKMLVHLQSGFIKENSKEKELHYADQISLKI